MEATIAPSVPATFAPWKLVSRKSPGKIQALGNPPNPLAAKCEAGSRFKKAVRAAQPSPEGPWILEGEWIGYSESDQYSFLLPRQIVHWVFFKGGLNPMTTEPMRSLLGFTYAGGMEPPEILWTKALLEGIEGDRLEYSYETNIEGRPATVRVVASRVSDTLPPPVALELQKFESAIHYINEHIRLRFPFHLAALLILI